LIWRLAATIGDTERAAPFYGRWHPGMIATMTKEKAGMPAMEFSAR
jgi:hypothetical protein